ncbi:hypothetical protein DL764_001436 [Monosporascus ibericus]|uniref:Xylanolytic transcriptional activator regulatory domain-containing protein n=1 Tax=Monosporascus ibericus TaxID=155417 RepID=A0A4Q4TPI6_9PEZI|nr:hypothetical protein DL764_001436 [Monosporascus ibericus]
MTELAETVTELKTRLDQGPQEMQQSPPSADAGSNAARSPVLTRTGKSSHRRDSSFQRLEVPKQPHFIGPTRSAYSIEIGTQSLTRMGIPLYDPPPSGPQSAVGSPQQTTTLDSGFWQRCDAGEVLRLIEVFQEEVASVYPCLDTDDLAAETSAILSWGRCREADDSEVSESVEGSGSGLSFKDFQLAKVAIATAIVVEEHGKNDNSTRMVESAERSVSRIMKPASDLKDLQLLVILSIYYFHCDEDLLAWRTIGIAARESLVMGLHRKATFHETFKDESQRSLGTRVFWCIYVLDRRWSFGTSLPFALHDGDIDPELPEPCMVGYGRLCSSIWDAIMSFGTLSNSISEETIAALDMKIQEWLESIPSHLQLRHPRLGLASKAQPRVLHRLRALLYLRGNHTRILIYRHHLLSPSRIKSDLRSAWLVAEIAQDSIQVLVHLNATSDIYRRQQSAFNYFLLSALAVIFLAVCHAPAVYAEPCRKSFHAAVQLVRDFSRRSHASRRLWNSIKGLLPRLRTLGMRGAEESTEPDNTRGSDNYNNSNNNNSSSMPPQRKAEMNQTSRGVMVLDQVPPGGGGCGDVSGPGFEPQHLQPSPLGVHTMDSDMDARTNPNGTTPNMFQMSNDLMALFDVFEQGQQFPIDLGLDCYPNHGTYPTDSTIGEPGEISRRFQWLI